METKNLPVDELQRLLTAVSEHGSQHLLEVEADLGQTAFLLAEAISKLGAGFLRIHAAISAQQQAVDALLASRGATAEAAEDIETLRGEIAEEINGIVTGLQFQDLTSQLITRSLKRVNGLRDLLSALVSHGDGMPGAHEHEAIASLLEQINRSLSARSGELQNGLRQEVKQQHMSSGDIELF